MVQGQVRAVCLWYTHCCYAQFSGLCCCSSRRLGIACPCGSVCMTANATAQASSGWLLLPCCTNRMSHSSNHKVKHMLLLLLLLSSRPQLQANQVALCIDHHPTCVSTSCSRRGATHLLHTGLRHHHPTCSPGCCPHQQLHSCCSAAATPQPAPAAAAGGGTVRWPLLLLGRWRVALVASPPAARPAKAAGREQAGPNRIPVALCADMGLSGNPCARG